MKKISSYIMLLMLLISIESCKSQMIDKIDIIYVDSEIETPIRIDCQEFTNYFGDIIDSISIQDPVLLSEFIDALDNLVLADSLIYSPVDTRSKFILYSKNTVFELCLDRFAVSKNNELFILSDQLRDLINSSILNNANYKHEL